MMKYKILYSKSGYPLTAWCNNESDARTFVAAFRKAGYEVTVWACDRDGAKKTDI